MNYYKEIKDKIINNEVYSNVKDYSKEKNRVTTYFEIGKLLNEAGKKYGDDIIGQYSKRLTIEIGKKYNKRTLFRMKQFYILFSDPKVSPLATQLTWSHYIELLSIRDTDELAYYSKISFDQNLSRNKLRDKIKDDEYHRLPIESRQKLLANKKIDIKESVPNPVLIKNKNNLQIINEKILHHLILEDIASFMKGLGRGYSFIDSEYQIKMGNQYNYIDMLLFNIDFNCYVVIELKIGSLKKEHIGQIQIYMNYINAHFKQNNQNNTIGIIICKREDKYLIEYCSDDKIISREYRIV